jgi:hypothetical protein
MNMIAKKDETTLPAQSETTAILSLVARAAADPNVDPDKFERLLKMQFSVQAREAQSAFDGAMADMQPELPVVGERGDAAGRYTFALWEDIQAAVKPILQKHGFALTFRTDTADKITVTGILSHRKGHREETSITLPADPSGNKNAVQAVASSVAYGKRYTASALLNLTSHGEDDDAFNTASAESLGTWKEAIDGAADMVELNRIAAELKGNKSVSEPLKKKIRALWAKRAGEVK